MLKLADLFVHALRMRHDVDATWRTFTTREDDMKLANLASSSWVVNICPRHNACAVRVQWRREWGTCKHVSVHTVSSRNLKVPNIYLPVGMRLQEWFALGERPPVFHSQVGKVTNGHLWSSVVLQCAVVVTVSYKERRKLISVVKVSFHDIHKLSGKFITKRNDNFNVINTTVLLFNYQH